MLSGTVTVRDKWMSHELSHLSLGDKRLKRRALRIGNALAANPTSSIPQSVGGWNEVHASCEFFSNPRVTAAKILSSHIKMTLQRALIHSVVLALHDTTSLNFTELEKTSGLGEIGDSMGKGLICQNTYLVSDSGIPLGLLDQQMWARQKS